MAGIYKAYDIRGIAEQELSEELAYNLGRAYVQIAEAKGKNIAVGHDMRATSKPYSNALIRGLRDGGANVINVGLVSTPLFYFAVRNYDGGVMVTASHNPKEYNGFKFCGKHVMPINYENGINKMEALIAAGIPPAEGEQGTLTQQEFLEEYINFNLNFLKITKKVSIVVDAANGMGGHTYGKLREVIQDRLTLHPVFFELDGSFPNHEANPIKEEAAAAMKKGMQPHPDAVLGLSLDGDGDRCIFFDETGRSIPTDITLILIAESLLAESPGSLIFYDNRSSRVVPEAIEKLGGRPEMTPSGYAKIRPLMHDKGALIAGELSGHLFTKETNNTENTMYMLFQILNLLERTGKKLSELANPLRKYVSSGEVSTRTESPEEIIEKIDAEYGKRDDVVNRIDFDGIRLEFPDWWFLVRKSNTEPLIRLIVEANDQAAMEAKRDELLKIIRKEE